MCFLCGNKIIKVAWISPPGRLIWGQELAPGPEDWLPLKITATPPHPMGTYLSFVPMAEVWAIVRQGEGVGVAKRAMDMSLSELRELLMDREAWRAAIHGVASRARTRSPSPRAWRPDFPGAARECGTRGSLRTMHGGGSAPSCCAFTHRVAFEEALSHSRGQRGSLPQTRRGLTLLSQLCRDPAVGVRNEEEA